MPDDIEKETKIEVPSEEKEGGFEIMSPGEVEKVEAGWQEKQEELKKEGYEKDIQFLGENKENISPPLESEVLENIKESLDEKWGIRKEEKGESLELIGEEKIEERVIERERKEALLENFGISFQRFGVEGTKDQLDMAVRNNIRKLQLNLRGEAEIEKITPALKEFRELHPEINLSFHVDSPSFSEMGEIKNQNELNEQIDFLVESGVNIVTIHPGNISKEKYTQLNQKQREILIENSAKFFASTVSRAREHQKSLTLAVENMDQTREEMKSLLDKSRKILITEHDFNTSQAEQNIGLTLDVNHALSGIPKQDIEAQAKELEKWMRQFKDEIKCFHVFTPRLERGEVVKEKSFQIKKFKKITELYNKYHFDAPLYLESKRDLEITQRVFDLGREMIEKEQGSKEVRKEGIFKERSVTSKEIKKYSPEEKIEGKSEISKEYLEQEYAVKRLKEIKALLSSYFPEFYKDISSIKIEYNFGRPELKVSHKMEGGTHFIKMEIPQDISEKENFGDLPTEGPLSEGYKKEKYSVEMPRRFTDLFYLNHEYLHSLEPEIILKNYKGEIPENLKKENLVLGEGFQVSTELILVEKIEEDADKLGLSREDIETLDRFKKMRLKKLKDTGEIDEMLLFYRMYKEKGSQAIEEFVNSNEVERTLEKVAERQRILEAVKEIYADIQDLKEKVERKEVTKNEAITRAIEKARSNSAIAEYLSKQVSEIVDSAFESETEAEYISSLEKYKRGVEAKLGAKFPPEKKGEKSSPGVEGPKTQE